MIPEEERAIRAKVRAHLVGQGVPRDVVDEIVDLSFHAAQAAADAIWDVVGRASSEGIKVTAIGVAVGVAQWRLEAIENGIKSYGSAMGHPVQSFTIGGE